MSNFIYEYYQGIQDGSIVVGHFIKLWYGYIIQGLQDKKFYYDHKQALRSIRFMETFLHHHEGELAPQLVKLELWQKALLSVLFGIVDGDGVRQFREAVIVIGRKNGKTLLASGIALYLSYLGDYGARTYFIAPKLEQATLGYDALYQSILKEPDLSSIAKKRRTDIYIAQNNATIKPLAFSERRSDGLNCSCVICDEISSWRGEPGIRMYEVLTSSTGARKSPLVLSISTSGYENNGIYDELIKRGTRVLLGGSREKRLAPFLYMIDDLSQWNSLSELQKANPNLGVSLSVDYLLEQIAIAEGSLPKKNEFIAKFGNIKQNSTQAWLSTETVEKCMGEPFTAEDLKHSYCVGGLDLSQTTDLTCAMVVTEKHGELYVFSQFFMPAEKVDEATERDGVPYKMYIQKGWITPSGENFVNYEDVYQWFVRLVEEYEILPLVTGYDRYSSQYLVQTMKQYGFVMDDVFQGENLTPVIHEAEGLLKDGKVHIGDNDLLKMHFLDSALKTNNETSRVKLIKLRSNAHIDGMASFLDAICVRQKYYQEYGEQLKG